MNLDQIGIKHGTGKSSMQMRYLSFYEKLFPQPRHHIDLLEIGVQFGLSLKTWADYYPNAHITGVDVVSNNLSFTPADRITLVIGDAYTPEMVAQLGANNHTYEIIIDDASHAPQDQVWFVANYPKLLDPDGILIVEDVLAASTVPLLMEALPEGFHWTTADMTMKDSPVASRLFIAWKI